MLRHAEAEPVGRVDTPCRREPGEDVPILEVGRAEIEVMQQHHGFGGLITGDVIVEIAAVFAVDARTTWQRALQRLWSLQNVSRGDDERATSGAKARQHDATPQPANR